MSLASGLYRALHSGTNPVCVSLCVKYFVFLGTVPKTESRKHSQGVLPYSYASSSAWQAYWPLLSTILMCVSCVYRHLPLEWKNDQLAHHYVEITVQVRTFIFVRVLASKWNTYSIIRVQTTLLGGGQSKCSAIQRSSHPSQAVWLELAGRTGGALAIALVAITIK